MRERLERLGREGLPPSSAAAYLFAASCAVLAAVAHVVFLQFAKEIMPSIFYNPAVFVAALFGGIGAGVLAAGLSIVFLWYIFISLYAAHDITPVSPVTACALYLFAAAVIIWIADRYRAFGRRGRARSVEQPGAAAGAALPPALLRARLRQWWQRGPHPNSVTG